MTTEARGTWVLVLLALGCAARGSGEREDAPASTGGSSASSFVCGGPDQACCMDTRVACMRGSSCDADAGVCRAGSGPAALACRTDEHCAPDRRCCNAGLYGTCQALEPEASCPLPDLGVLAGGAGLTVQAQNFDGVTPSEGGCVREVGVRYRLRASVAVANLGAADFILGDRNTLPVGSVAPHDDFLRYTLLDAAGAAVASSRGPLPCSAGADAAQPFTCDFAGVAAGSIVTASGLECEALDVTDLPAGEYRLRVELAREWPDSDPSNRRLELPVDLPSFDPLLPCPAVNNPLSDVGAYRECGWSPAPLPGAGSCVPGELIVLDCGGCVNAPVLRLCAGDGACRAPAAVAVASGYSITPDGSIADPCTGLLVTCPPLGRYNVLIASEDPALESTCTLAFSPDSP